MFYTQSNCKHRIDGIQIASLACEELVLDRLEHTLPKSIKHCKEEDLKQGKAFTPDIFIVGSSWTPAHSIQLGVHEIIQKTPVIMVLEEQDHDIRLNARKYGVVDFIITETLSDSLLLAIKNILKLICQSKQHQPTNDLETVGYIKTIDFLLRQKPSLSVTDFCEYEKISQPSLYRKVKKALGISPAQLIMDRRCQQAKYLLINTDNSISRIAYQTGFNSPAHFSRVFKKAFGKPPRIYRVDTTE